MKPRIFWCEIHGPVSPTATATGMVDVEGEEKLSQSSRVCRIHTGHDGAHGSLPYCGEPVREASLEEVEPFVLDWLDRALDRSKAPLVYVHDVRGKLGEGAILAALVPKGDLLDAAMVGMESAGWNPYDHDHFDGSDS